MVVGTCDYYFHECSDVPFLSEVTVNAARVTHAFRQEDPIPAASTSRECSWIARQRAGLFSWPERSP